MSRFSGPGKQLAQDGWFGEKPSRIVKTQKRLEADERNAATPDERRRANREPTDERPIRTRTERIWLNKWVKEAMRS